MAELNHGFEALLSACIKICGDLLSGDEMGEWAMLRMQRFEKEVELASSR